MADAEPGQDGTRDHPGPAWRRSSRCSNSGCVEVRLTQGRIELRDSKRPGSPVLVYDDEEWQAFIDGVKAGEFDLP